MLFQAPLPASQKALTANIANKEYPEMVNDC